MKYYIVGYMCAGKSTYARRLANELHLRFIDLDIEIERRTGCEIRDLFNNLGEDAFRQFEREALLETLNVDDVVVSCGGGTPCFFDNMELMNKNGITRYLKTPLDTLIHRLNIERQGRPVLANVSGEELPKIVEQQLNEREKFYSQAKEMVEQ